MVSHNFILTQDLNNLILDALGVSVKRGVGVGARVGVIFLNFFFPFFFFSLSFFFLFFSFFFSFFLVPFFSFFFLTSQVICGSNKD